MVDMVHNLVTDQKKNSLKSGQIYNEDAQYVETNEKSILRFWDMNDFVIKFIFFVRRTPHP